MSASVNWQSTELFLLLLGPIKVKESTFDDVTTHRRALNIHEARSLLISFIFHENLLMQTFQKLVENTFASHLNERTVIKSRWSASQ